MVVICIYSVLKRCLTAPFRMLSQAYVIWTISSSIFKTGVHSEWWLCCYYPKRASARGKSCDHKVQSFILIMSSTCVSFFTAQSQLCIAVTSNKSHFLLNITTLPINASVECAVLFIVIGITTQYYSSGQHTSTAMGVLHCKK